MANGSPTITHLFFADDSLVFFKASKDNTDRIKDCLQRYERASGQLINYDKSAITLSNLTSQGNANYVKDRLHLHISQGHELYLGLPTFRVKSKRMQFGYLRDRVIKRMEAWHSKFLEGGREVLIKSVIQAIPTYVMSFSKYRRPSIKKLSRCALTSCGAKTRKKAGYTGRNGQILLSLKIKGD